MASITAYHSYTRTELGVAGFIDYGLGASAFLLIYVCATACNELRGIRVVLCRYLFIAAAVMGLVGLLQTLKFSPALDLGTLLTGNQYISDPLAWKVPRSVGFFNSWHAFAGYSCLSLVLIVSCGLAGLHIYKRKWALPVCALLIACGLLSSLTFGMIILGACILALLSWRYHKTSYIVCGAAAFAILYTFTPLSDSTQRRVQMQEAPSGNYDFLPQTVSFRIDLWIRDFLPLIADNPMFGYGPLTEANSTFSYVESMYILVLLLGGATALCAFIVLIASIILTLAGRLRTTTKSCETSVEVEHLSRAALYFAVGLIPLMLIHPYMNDAGASQLLIVLVGLLTVRKSTASGRRAATPLSTAVQ